MPLNFPNTGENIALGVLVNKTAAQDLVLRLYQNNIVPSDTDTAATYTEATFSGYAPITLTGSSWGTPTNGSISYAQQTFTHDGGGTSNNIYGYYVTQVGSGILVYSERDPSAAFLIANLGDNIKITPTITAD